VLCSNIYDTTTLLGGITSLASVMSYTGFLLNTMLGYMVLLISVNINLLHPDPILRYS